MKNKKWIDIKTEKELEEIREKIETGTLDKEETIIDQVDKKDNNYLLVNYKSPIGCVSIYKAIKVLENHFIIKTVPIYHYGVKEGQENIDKLIQEYKVMFDLDTNHKVEQYEGIQRVVSLNKLIYENINDDKTVDTIINNVSDGTNKELNEVVMVIKK